MGNGLDSGHAGPGEAVPGEAVPAAGVPVRVFISYAHDDLEHVERVRDFWLFLRAQRIDARLDLPAAEQRQDWAEWMTREVREARHVLVVASPEYKRRAEGDARPDEGRGVQWEARLIREVFYADQKAGLQRILPVVLPGCSADDIPLWLGPQSAAHYPVTGFTVAGTEKLLRLLTSQPWETMPELGTAPTLAPRGTGGPEAPERPVLHTEVVLEAALSDGGVLDSAVWVAGSPLCRRQAPLPAEVAGVWGALKLPALAAGQRLADAGLQLAAALLDEDSRRVLAGLLDRLPPGDTVEVVLVADGLALSLPAELMRLTTDTGGEVGPLGLLPAVSVSRRPSAAGQVPGQQAPDPAPAAAGMAGPLKVLAAVAAPDETETRNSPLDAEAEMQAVLDAVTDVAGDPHAEVRILEVASLPAIRQALAEDAFHVLHLSAHGSPDSVELEDEDGAPVEVTTGALTEALRHAGRRVPLIVLSSCSGGSSGSEAMAAGLITHGADRVIAMLAPVTDAYATTLARHFYRGLSGGRGLTAGQALARARYLAEEDRSRASGDHLPVPEFGVPTLLTAGGDGPLVDVAAPAEPLSVRTTPPGGKLARDLPMGTLIGRRAQLRTTMGVLRRTPEAVRRSGVASGAVLTGIGGIGKTAVAGRVISRLRDDGWLIAVHEGRWNPAALITATARTLDEALARTRDTAQAAALARLTDPGADDGPKLAVIAGLLASCRLLVVFDDFEQNLTPGGEAFLDPAIDEVITGLADSADTGALLLTCRYPLPGPDRFLAQVPIPALSGAELRRLFLRLPALAGLDAEDRRMLTRTIGGHPRLIEFTDALLRGGHASLRHVQVKLRDLARAEGVDLGAEQSLAGVLDQAMLLGSADILLTELLGLLTPRQADVLRQVAVCRAPMTLGDLAYTLEPSPDAGSAPAGSQPGEAALRADVDRLTDLTLLTPGENIVMHPWTADLVTRNTEADLSAEHEQALAMRLRRFEQQRGSYEDLIDIPRHLAALHRYDDIVGIADQATRALRGTLATVAYLAEIRPLIPPIERTWIIVAELEVQALLNAGNLPAATRQRQAIHQQIRARTAADPANSEWQRDLSVSHNKLGDMAMAAGDLTAARTAYQASLDIRVRLAAADPANTQWQRDLSISHNKLGDMAMAAGDLTAARTAYQADLDIAVRLAAADPANTQWQRDLSISHNKLGNVAMRAGDLTAARTAYQAYNDIAVRLATADPANTQWQRDLSVSHNKLGDVATAAGDLTAARTAYQADLDIAVRLAATDPANTQWQRDLSVSHNKLGDVATAAGDLAAARTAYQASLDIAVRLAAADPANTQWQRDLSISHDKLGNVATAAGDLAAARTAYQASLDIRVRLAAADPANTEWQRDLSVSHDKLGNVATAAGDLAAARTAYQASLDIAVRLAAADPANAQWQHDLSISHNKLGDVAVAAGDLTTARTAYQASLDIRVRLAAADPANAQWQHDLVRARQLIKDLPDSSE
jgi:CHAT domain/TIR domain